MSHGRRDRDTHRDIIDLDRAGKERDQAGQEPLRVTHASREARDVPRGTTRDVAPAVRMPAGRGRRPDGPDTIKGQITEEATS